MVGYRKASTNGNGNVMKNLLAVAVLIAGALSVSARVDWIPTTPTEIKDYAKTQFNEIYISLGRTNEDGSYDWVFLRKSGGSWRQHGTPYTNSFWDPGVINLEGFTSNKVAGYLQYFLTNTDGYSDRPVEGQKYFINVRWAAFYNTNGLNADSDGLDPLNMVWGDTVNLSSDIFTLQKVGDQFVMPSPEALQLSGDWWAFHVVVPAVSSHPIWVDYRIHQNDGSPDWTLATTNGLNPGCEGAEQRNGFLHIDPGQIIWGANATKLPGAWSTVVVWYDENRTDGTEWRWENGVATKREIFPPKLTAVPSNGGGLQITLTGAIPGQIYYLDEVPPTGGIQTQGADKAAIADTNGVATWVVDTSGRPSGFFKLRQ